MNAIPEPSVHAQVIAGLAAAALVIIACVLSIVLVWAVGRLRGCFAGRKRRGAR